MKRKFLTSTLIILSVFSLTACSDANKFDVSSKKGTTYITIPGELNPSTDLPKILADAGFTETESESDNSVTYSIPDDNYKAFIDDAHNTINNYTDAINNSESYTSITKVKLNKDMDIITADIDTENFEESNEELALNALVLKILHYKAYTGEELSVKIKLIDDKTNDVYDTITIQQ